MAPKRSRAESLAAKSEEAAYWRRWGEEVDRQKREQEAEREERRQSVRRRLQRKQKIDAFVQWFEDAKSRRDARDAHIKAVKWRAELERKEKERGEKEKKKEETQQCTVNWS